LFELNEATRKLSVEEEKLAKLAAEEARIKAAIEGRTIRDLEYGLTLKPVA
jgi:hypothetical protein